MHVNERHSVRLRLKWESSVTPRTMQDLHELGCKCRVKCSGQSAKRLRTRSLPGPLETLKNRRTDRGPTPFEPWHPPTGSFHVHRIRIGSHDAASRTICTRPVTSTIVTAEFSIATSRRKIPFLHLLSVIVDSPIFPNFFRVTARFSHMNAILESVIF